MSKPDLSVVIPVFNESQRITTIPTIVRYLKTLSLESELIIVNDGSQDDTLKKLKKYANKYQLKILSYKKNRGKGYALTRGMQSAKGKYHLFMDVDLSVPLSSIKPILNMLEKTDIVIGTRRDPKSKVTQNQSWLRESMGQVFTKISQFWLGLDLSDFTCGFKIFSRKASRDIFSKTKLPRWGFDPEVLFIAKQRGWKIKEMPVKWKNDQRSKVRFPQDIIRSFKELVLIRYFDVKGVYIAVPKRNV